MRPSILDQIANKTVNTTEKINPSILDKIANKGLQYTDSKAPVELQGNLTPNPEYSFREDNTIKDQDILQSEFDSAINSFRRGIDETQKSNYLGKLDSHQEIIDNNVDKQNSWIASYKRGLIDKNKLDIELAKIDEQNVKAQKEIDSFRSDIEDNLVEIDNEYVSKLYQMKEAAVQAKGGDAGLWESIKYTAPSTAGSSASLMGQQLAATFGAGLVKKLATNLTAGLVGGPIGEGIAVASTIATTLGLLANSRYQETMAEIGSQIEGNSQKLLEQWQEANPGQEPNEEVLRQIRKQARLGKDELFKEQMTLVLPDAIESILMPGSKVLGAFKSGRALEQTVKGITDYNKFTRVGKLGAKLYTNYLGEKFEEGFQYASEKRQTAKALGLDDYEDKGFISNLLADSFDTLESLSYGPWGTLQGKNGRYSQDKEFQFAEQSGGLLAILPGGIAAGVNLYKDINTYRQTNKELQNSGIANPEDKWFRLKDQIYAKHFDNNTMEYLLEGVRNLKTQKNDKGVPFLTESEAASETENIKKAFDKYLEVSKHIEDIIPEDKFGLKLSNEQKIKINALKNDLFHSSMQMVRNQERLPIVESLNNINDLISKQEDLIDTIKSTVDNSTIRKTYNIEARIKIAENKLKTLNNKKAALLSESGLTEKDLPSIDSIEESNKNKQYLINDLNITEINENYKDLLKIKDNKTLNEWFSKREKKKADLIKSLTEATLEEEQITPEFAEEQEGRTSEGDDIDKFINRLQSGESLSDPKDIEFYQQNKEEIENRIKASKTIETQQEELKSDQQRIEAEKRSQIEQLKQRASKQKELEEAFNSVKNLQDLSSNSRVKYKGMEGRVSKSSEENVFQFIDDKSGKIYDLPQHTEFGYEGKLYDYDVYELPKENPITDLIDIEQTDEGLFITINGKSYFNRYSNPLSAINRNKEGEIVSINLETEDGKKRTFKKYAEEIAYAILLHTYNQLENESTRTREEVKSKLTGKTSKVDIERKESTITERDSEESKKIEEAITNLEKGIKESQEELNKQLNKLFEDSEKLAKIAKEKPNTTVLEYIEGIDEASNEKEAKINPLFDLQGKLAQSPYKSTAGEDNDKKTPEQRYFRFLEKNNLKEGTKLLVVTRNNNKELFDKLFDEDAKKYEEENGIETIYTVFVDSNNNYILANQDGTISEKGELVYSTILSEQGVDTTGIKDKETAKKELKAFRSSLLEQKGNVYLPIKTKSNGIRIREKNADKSRKFNPVQGYITSDLSKEGLLELPTIVIGDKGITELSNGQQVTARKLYAKSDETGEFIDLFARNLSNDEAMVVTALIAQKMGITPKNVDNIGDELDKLIYFGIPKDGPKSYTLGVKDGLLYVGDKVFTKEQLGEEETQNYLENFLLNFKYVNANAKIDFNEEFKEPILNTETGAIEYKTWKTYQEFLLSNKDGRTPLFGTDVPAIGKPKYRNYYVNYEPTIVSGDIKVSQDEIKPDNTSAESTDFNNSKDYENNLDKSKKSTNFVVKDGKKVFKKSGSSRIIKIDDKSIDNKEINKKIKGCE